MLDFFSISLHRPTLRGLALFLSMAALLSPLLAASPMALQDHARHGRQSFLYDMPQTVRADHPEIVPVAEAIRAVTRKPLEQLVAVHHVTHLLVDYDSDQRVYQRKEYHATLDEMIELRDVNGWTQLRDDCDGRAVFAAHLLAALEIPWRLEVSFWKRHAWISAEVNGVRYDLLDLRPSDPELQTVTYRFLGRMLTRSSRPPPAFNWRQAWLARTGADVDTGLRLGLLARGSRPGNLQERFAVNWTRPDPTGMRDRHLANMASAHDDESKG